MTNGKFNSDLAKEKYMKEMRYLSKRDAIEGLKIFSEQILQFNPREALFFLPQKSESAQFMHNNLIALKPELAQYGIVRKNMSEKLILDERNTYGSGDPTQAKTFIYVDDWILSGEHMRSFLTTDIAGKLQTYHLAVSTAGQKFLHDNSDYITPHYLHTMPANPSSSNLFPRVSVYGFHKIPDTLPDYFAKSPYYSIFGRRDRFYIRIHQHLVDHTAIFVPTSR